MSNPLSAPRCNPKLATSLRAVLAAMVVVTAMMVLGPAKASGESEIRSWITDIRQQAGWAASFRRMTRDGDGAVKLSGLSIRSVPAGPAITFNTIVFKNPVYAPNGGLSADSIGIELALIKTDEVTIELADMVLSDVVLPDLRDFLWRTSQPNASLARAYGLLGDMSLSSGTVSSVEIIEHGNGVESRIFYEGMALRDWTDGRIAELMFGPMRMESPIPETLVTLTSSGFEARGIDLKALRHVFDPDRYINGRGDGIWRNAIESTVYGAVTLSAPGAAVTIDQVTMDNVRVRQPPRSFVEYLDQTALEAGALDDSDEVIERAYDIVSAFEIESFVAEKIDIQAAGIDRLSLDRFSLSDASSDYLGELAFDGLTASVIGEGLLRFSRFALGRVEFPEAGDVRRAIRSYSSSNSGKSAPIYPRIGFVEISGLDAESGQTPRVQLTKLSLELDNYLGRIPTRINLELAGARWPTSLVPDLRGRTMLAALGYDRIDLSLTFHAAWSEADETIIVDDFTIAVRDAGSADGGLILSGVTRKAIEALQEGRTPPDLNFSRSAMTFHDSSIVERALTYQANQMKVDPELFREQFAGALPFMISFIGDPEFQKKIAPVLQDFIRGIGMITITSEPTAPISVAKLLKVLSSAPQKLPELLAVTVSGTAAPAPENQTSE